MQKLGFASTIINPSLKALLVGYAPLREYLELHSNLLMRVVVVNDGSADTVFITMDTVAIDAYLFKRFVKALSKHSIKDDRIFASASHTHSAQAGMVNTRDGIFKGLTGIFGEYDEVVVERITETLIELFLEAKANQEELLGLRIADGDLSGVGAERHDASLPGDQRFVCWEFETTSHKKVLFYNFACHPTVLNGSSNYLSADFPGDVAELLKDKYQSVCFVNGSCGDISTRFTRTSADVKQVREFAKVIVDKIEELLLSAELVELEELKTFSKSYFLKTKVFDSLEVAQEKLEKAQEKSLRAVDLPLSERRIVESFFEGARTNLTFVKNFQGIDEVELKITFLKINDYGFVTMPAELFSSLSNQLREELKLNFLGYTNGYCLYITDKEAYEKGFYEALSSIYEKGQGEKLMSEISADYQKFNKER